jgi:hypothetical protein
MLAAALVGCERDEPGPRTPRPTPVRIQPVVFASDAYSKDPTVNAFVREAIEICIRGDYEAFRLLWSAREEPLTEQEFLRGWRAVQRVTIQQITEMQTPAGEIVYGVRGQVELDPDEVPEPVRDIVLVLVGENDQWRIRRAPGGVRKVMNAGREGGRADGAAGDPNSEDTRPSDDGRP